MGRMGVAAAAALLALAGAVAAQEAGRAGVLGEDPVLDFGAQVFRECRDCHQIGPGARSRVGPHLNDVIGRPAGGLDDYRYSPAMRAAGASGLAWSEQNLDRYIRNPRLLVPRTSMAYAGMRSEFERAALIAYIVAAGAATEAAD